MVEDRIAALEAHAATLEARVRTLEGGAPAARPWANTASHGPSAPGRASAPGAPLVPPSPTPAPPAAAPRRDLEDILGGSVLAWLGGFAVLAGLAFLLTIAVSRGWIGEGARTALAGVLSLGLLGTGIWLREHRGRIEAALAAAAIGIAGTFGTLVVAGSVYMLLPRPLALLGAFATGAAATLLALRWRAPVMGWLGLLGALWAPAALGALDGGGIAFLAIAYAATVIVLVRQRWSVLAGFAAFSATAQWAAWLLATDPSSGTALAVLVVFGLLTAALALGLEANRRGLHRVTVGPVARTSVSHLAVALLVLGALVLATAGWWAFAGDARWLVALAVSFLALGLGAVRVPRISRELALIALAIGVVLANLAFAALASGLPLVLGWALSAIPFAALLGARSGAALPGTPLVDRILGRPDGEAAVRADRILAIAGLIGQLTLTAFQGLLFDAQPTALAGPAAPVSALIAAAAVALVAWGCARLAGPGARTMLDVVALAAVAHFTGLALEGAALTAVLAAEALALAELARRRADPVAAWAAVAFAVGGLLHALVVIAPPSALIDGLDAPLAAAGALLAAAVALAVAGRVPGIPRALVAVAALTLLYLASIEIVTAAAPARTGQTLVSVLWAVAGVGALVRGLVTDDRPLRIGALALLALTAGKVFLYDLSSLDSMSRVGSLIGFGLLLLVGSFAWQRARPTGARGGRPALPLEP